MAALPRDVLHGQRLSRLDLPGENIHANLGAQAAEPVRSGDRGSFVLVSHIVFQSQPAPTQDHSPGRSGHLFAELAAGLSEKKGNSSLSPTD